MATSLLKGLAQFDGIRAGQEVCLPMPQSLFDNSAPISGEDLLLRLAVFEAIAAIVMGLNRLESEEGL